MAEFNNFYRSALYYDIVFRRDVSPEVEFVRDVYKSLHGAYPASFLELACGPGYHTTTAASLGMRAVGLDLNEEMLEFARDYAAEQDLDTVKPTWIAADMRYLELDAPVDVALNPFDGIDCLLTNTDLRDHFQAVAANLTPGGLYFVDVTNPRYTSFSHYQKFNYAGERDGISVRINWAINDPHVDPVTSISHTELEIFVDDNGRKHHIKDSAQERVLCGQEIALLCEWAGTLRPVAWYGAYDLNYLLETRPNAERMIAVLQKT